MSENGRLLLGTMPRPKGGGAGRAFRKTLPGGAFETVWVFYRASSPQNFSKAPQWHFVTPQDNRSLMSGWSGVVLLGHGWQHICFGCLGIYNIHPSIHTYIHTDRHTDRQTDIQTYRHTYIHTDSHTDKHTHRQTYIRTDVHSYIHTYIHLYIQTDIQTYRQTYIRTDIHSYIHTYRHTDIHTYIPRTYNMHAYTRACTRAAPACM